MTSHWYVVQTKPGGEGKALLNLSNQHFEAYLPRYRKERRHARKVDTVLRPLFPGYLFVRFDEARDRWRSINGTLGVSRLMTQGEKPLPLDDAVIDDIRLREDEQGVVSLAPRSLKPGQSVRIRQGAFAEHIGLFEAKADAERVVLLLKLLGREVRIKAPLDYLEEVG